MDSDPSIPTRTADKVSDLPNGTYFWRMKDTQDWYYCEAYQSVAKHRNTGAIYNGLIVKGVS